MRSVTFWLSRSPDVSSKHHWRIILLCIWVIAPMFIFTGIIIWLIFCHLISRSSCPYPELCIAPEDMSLTGTDTHYIVDFPATSLVFIASWSSTLGLSFVGILMTIFAYVVAERWLGSLNSTQSTPKLLTPYQTGLLLRILNAELITLPEILSAKMKEVFWMRKKSNDHTSTNSVLLNGSTVVFGMGIFLSLLIQAADTYLHITTKSFEWTQITQDVNSTNHYSYILGPWCLDREPEKSLDDRDFWSCNLGVQDRVSIDSNGTRDTLYQYMSSNESHVRRMSLGRSPDREVFNYRDEEGDHAALLGPRLNNSNTDWTASTFGVTTKCQSIPQDMCENSDELPDTINIGDTTFRAFSFNCTFQRSGLNASGLVHFGRTKTAYLDFHRSIDYPRGVKSESLDLVHSAVKEFANSSNEGGRNDFFANHWNWFTIFAGQYPVEDKRVWKVGSMTFLMLHCNTSVWDIEKYSFVNNKVMNVSRHLSNSSTTGIISMGSAPVVGFATEEWTKVWDAASFDAHEVEPAIEVFTDATNRLLLYYMSGQTTMRPAFQVQQRRSKLMTRVRKDAIWALITANLLFVLLALFLTFFALLVASEDVHQIQTRMNVMGLTAQLFEYSFAKRAVKGSKELFKEHDGEHHDAVKRVVVEPTDEGGAIFTLSERWKG